MHSKKHIDKTLDTSAMVSELLKKNHGLKKTPFLTHIEGKYTFKFTEEKSSFLLGKLKNLDFLVDEKNVAHEHASFVRDINGIRLIPISHSFSTLNGHKISDGVILSHGDVLTFGELRLIFLAYNDPVLLKNLRKKWNEEAALKEKAKKSQKNDVVLENQLEKNRKGKCWFRFDAIDKIFLSLCALTIVSVFFFSFMM